MIIDDFSNYQIDWLTSHNDIEFSKEEEDLIVRFIKDTAEMYQRENQCEDCISRKDILEAIETWDKFGVNAEQKLIRWNDHYVPYVHLDDVRHAIANMPPVTPSYNSVKSELTPRTNLAETSQDCISRNELLSRIDAERKHLLDIKMDGAEHVIVHHARRIIEDMPTVKPQQRWIPVSERLPEDYIHVLCQFTLGGMGECYLAHGAFHVVGGLVMTCNEVIAWMPLPERYEIPEQTFGCAED
jgi:hypothetical protein